MAFRDKFRGIFQVKEPPHRIAISFALGVFWGMSPLLGIHAIGAFFTAWLFGLNRFVAVAGVYITNPWTIVPIYSFSLLVGAKVVGIKEILPVIDWNSVTIMYMIDKLTPLILPFFIGTFLVGAVSGMISYFVIYKMVARYKSRRGHGS